MVFKEQLRVSGSWLFRWRSYLPLLVIVLALPAAANFNAGFKLDQLWEILCLTISLAGLGIRIYVVGYAHSGTSGRSTTRQEARVLNTTGMYSVVRHPLYLGNYFIWLGLSMFFRLWWFSLIVSLIFLVYYERIIFAEEEFLHEKFGDKFLEWASRTPAFIPDFRNWKPPCQPFAFRTVLKREQSGLMAIAATFACFEVLGDLLHVGRFVIDTMWIVIFFTSLFIFLILTGLKKARLL